MGISVCHIATRDIAGGAAIGAYRIHAGLRRIGVSSEMLVGQKTSEDPHVHVARHDLPLLWKLQREFARVVAKAKRKRLPTSETSTAEPFSDDRATGRTKLAGQIPATDIVHLHWVSGFVDYPSFFPKLQPGRPLVWTLADMNPFSGGCHYSLGCERYENSCGSCPQLGSHDENDLSAIVLKRKIAALSALRHETTAIVVLSKWTQSMAERSRLFGERQIIYIPYSLDTDVFQPSDRNEARQQLGLPADEPLLLFVADSIGNSRKGFDLLQAALAEWSLDRPVTVVSVGRGGQRFDAGRYKHIPLGRIEDPKKLSLAYSAADVFVSPARAEMFGQVLTEAMACGTPVVAFATGGIPDIVRSGETGILAAPEDVRSLRNALETLLADEGMRKQMGRAGRQVVEDEYRFEIQAGRYKALYEDLIEASRRISVPN